jgi:type II secretory pathway component PulC
VTEPSKKIIQNLTTKPTTSIVTPDTSKFTMGVDPFVRDWVISGQVTDLKLKAITQSGDKAYALINDQILETGEVISGKKIVSIEKDKVILEQEGKTFNLLLGQ